MENENIKDELEQVEEVAVEKEVKPEYFGPKVTVVTDINFKTMKYYNMYSLFYRRKVYIIYAILVLIALGGGAYSFVIGNTLMGIIMCLFGVYMGYTAFTLEKKLDMNIANHFNHTRSVKLQMEITDEGITLANDRDPSQKNTYEWIYVSLIHEIDEYYYLFVNKQPIIVDKDPNAIIEGTPEELKAIIDKQIAVKPYKKIDKKLVKKPITYVQPEIKDATVVPNEEVAEEVNNEEVSSIEETVEETKDND